MLTDYFYPHIGGVEKVVYEISKRLVKLGHETVVITLNTNKMASFEILNGVKIYRCRSVNLTGLVGIQLSISLPVIFKILDICKKEKPDVIHAHNRFFFTTICAATLKRLLKIPLVTTFHLGSLTFGKRSLDLALKIYEGTISKWIIKNCDQIIAVSRAVKKHVVNLGASFDKVTVIPNGVDLEAFKPTEKSKDSSDGMKNVVFIGRLVFNKGAQYIVEAAPMVIARYPNTKFIIVGDGPMKSYLEKLSKKLGVTHAFKFLGTVPSIQEIFKQCDIFVRPSLTEGMSLAVLEAMSCGLPVIATKVAGTPEIIINNKTGILIDVKNVQQLADSILRLFSDPELLQSLSRNARLFVEKHYNWDRVTKLTLQVYEKMLNR